MVTISSNVFVHYVHVGSLTDEVPKIKQPRGTWHRTQLVICQCAAGMQLKGVPTWSGIKG